MKKVVKVNIAELVRINDDDELELVVALDDVLLTRDQVAALLNLKARTLDKWRSIGKGPRCTQLEEGSGPVRYRRSDVIDYINAGMQS